MDKTLKLYNFPPAASITKVIAISSTEPTDFKEGDYYINDSNRPVILYVAVRINDTLSWTQTSFQSSNYYLLVENSIPTLCYYSNSLEIGVDCGFPSPEDNTEIYSFSYSSSRMGNAPTIQATLEHRQCFDELWTDRTCVIFNDTLFFIDKKPSSQYSNESERYKHTIEFVSERKLLENVYFTNIVDYSSWEIDPVALETEFSFFGDISQVATRLNETMKYSKLHRNGIGFSIVVDDDQYTSDFISSLEEPEQLIEISGTTLKETLDLIFEKWGVPYYFDGYDIHIGFSNQPLMEDAGDSFPTFQYGIGNHILLTSKNQSNDIINRITGRGSSDNIPYYYPNETPNGIAAHYIRNGGEIQDAVKIAVPYRIGSVIPSTETTPEYNGDYVKFEEYEGMYKYDQANFTYHVAHLDVNQDGQLVSSSMPLDNVYLNVFSNCQTNYAHVSTNGTFCKRFYARLNRHENNTNLITTTGIIIKENISSNVEFNSGSAYYNIYSNSKSAKFEAWIYDLTTPTQEGWVYPPNNSQATKVLDLSYTVSIVNGRRVYNWSDGTTTQPSPTSDGISEKFPIQITSQEYGDVLVFSTTVYAEDDFYTYEFSDNYYGHDIGDVITDTAEKKRKTAKAEKYMKEVTRTIIEQTYLDTDRWVWHGETEKPYFILRDIGLKLSSSVTPQLDDIIYFDSSEVQPVSLSLLPSVYRENGDIWINARNNYYLKSSNVYYSFENTYVFSDAHESIQDNDNIKPTITGIYNDETPRRRIDRIVDVAFDANDNNEKDENGQYYHPYFFVKLAKTSVSGGKGFNLFDCASDTGTMTMNMKSGNCGGCAFEIGVLNGSDGFPQNPIAVFEQATTINGVTYAAGTPYRDSNGNVKTSGAPYQEEQQDTENNSVWIALKKDDNTFSPQVLPEGLQVPSANDEFVFTNINLPYAYVTAAEENLTKYLLDTMEEGNPRKYDYQIKLSSIFYKHAKEILDRWLNEAAKILFVYNGNTYEYYVDSYTYKMAYETSLPDVQITLKEKLKKRKSKWKELSDIFLEPREEIVNGKLKDETVGKLTVLDDIVMGDGTSLTSQISEFSQSIVTNAMRASEDTEKSNEDLSKKIGIKNLFADGTFLTDYNQFKVSSGDSAKKYGKGISGGNKIRMSIQENSEIYFHQKVFVDGGKDYTIAMNFMKEQEEPTRGVQSSECEIGIGIWLCKNVNGEEYQIGILYFDKTVTDDWNQYAAKFTTTDDTEYVRLSIYNGGDYKNVVFFVDGIMCFEGNLTYDYNDLQLPSEYVPSKYDIGYGDLKSVYDESKKYKNGIVVLRALPIDTARAGERYFFSRWITVKAKKSTYDFDLYKWGSVKSAHQDYETRRMAVSYPVLITIPYNFNPEEFVSSQSYRNSLLKEASGMTTQDLASPYFKIQNGEVICVKHPIVDTQKYKIFGIELGRKINRWGYLNRFIKMSKLKRGNGIGICHPRPAKTEKSNGARTKYKYKMSNPLRFNKKRRLKVFGVARRKKSIFNIGIYKTSGVWHKERWIVFN